MSMDCHEFCAGGDLSKLHEASSRTAMKESVD